MSVGIFFHEILLSIFFFRIIYKRRTTRLSPSHASKKTAKTKPSDLRLLRNFYKHYQEQMNIYICTFHFIKHKLQETTRSMSISSIFFPPYSTFSKVPNIPLMSDKNIPFPSNLIS